MFSCWQDNLSNRPSAEQIVGYFGTRLKQPVLHLGTRSDPIHMDTPPTVGSLSLFKRALQLLLIGKGMINSSMAVLMPDLSQWIQLQITLPHIAIGGAAVCLNEELYALGFDLYSKGIRKLGKNYNWLRLADMHVERTLITNSCVVLDGFIWALGGREGGNSTKSVEKYNPATNKWTEMP